MKNKSKTKLAAKKPASAKERENTKKNINKKPQATNPKNAGQKKSKPIESEKTNTIPKRENEAKLKKEEKELLSSLQKTNKDFIKVFVRFRPLNDLENDLLSDNCGWETPKYISDTQIGIYSTKEFKDSNAQIPTNLIFKYDKIFNSEAPQNQVYEYVGKRIVGDVMEGYNGTIFAYGQSGSGKTYTMYGPDIFDDMYKGIIPRIVEDIFNYVEKADDNVDFQFKLSVLEIYKEVMYDLLTQQSSDIKIQENPETGVVIEGLSEVYLSSLDEFFEYVDLSQSNRKTSVPQHKSFLQENDDTQSTTMILNSLNKTEKSINNINGFPKKTRTMSGTRVYRNANTTKRKKKKKIIQKIIWVMNKKR